MKKFKRIIAFTFVVLTIFLCVGCNNNSNNNNDNDNTPPPYTPPPIIQKKDHIDGFKFTYVSAQVQSYTEWFKTKYRLIFTFDITNVESSTNILHAVNFVLDMYVTSTKYYQYKNVALIDYDLEEKYFTAEQKQTTRFVIDKISEDFFNTVKDADFKPFYKTYQMANINFRNS